MPKLLHQAAIEQGALLKVANVDRRKVTRAPEFYFQVWAEDLHDASKEYPLLFTQKDFSTAAASATKRPELAPAVEQDKLLGRRHLRGVLQRVKNDPKKHPMEADELLYMWVRNNTGETLPDNCVRRGDLVLLRFSETSWQTVRHRAERNKSDVVQKSLLEDLTD